MSSSKKKIRGIKTQNVVKVSAVLGIFIIAFLVYALYSITGKYRNLNHSIEVYAQSQNEVASLRKASDYMTDQVRLFVITKRPVHMVQYFETVDEEVRENAIIALEGILDPEHYEESLTEVAQALEESNELMDYEIHAMKLITLINHMDEQDIPDAVKNYELTEYEIEQLNDAEKLEKAYNLVYGLRYRQDKQAIDDKTIAAIDRLSENLKMDAITSTDRLQEAIERLTFAVFGLLVLLMGHMIVTAILVYHPLHKLGETMGEHEALAMSGVYELKVFADAYNTLLAKEKESKERVRYKVEHDMLTHVYSREAFEEYKEILSVERLSLALLLVDVDQFKKVNDKYGHEVGDMTLTRIADLLRRSFRADDIIARIGGDEFAILLRSAGEEDAEQLAEKITRINDLLQHPINGDVKTSLSVGIAFSQRGYSEALFQRADEALYQAKANGRGGFVMCRRSERVAEEEEETEEVPEVEETATEKEATEAEETTTEKEAIETEEAVAEKEATETEETATEKEKAETEETTTEKEATKVEETVTEEAVAGKDVVAEEATTEAVEETSIESDTTVEESAATEETEAPKERKKRWGRKKRDKNGESVGKD